MVKICFSWFFIHSKHDHIKLCIKSYYIKSYEYYLVNNELVAAVGGVVPVDAHPAVLHNLRSILQSKNINKAF